MYVVLLPVSPMITFWPLVTYAERVATVPPLNWRILFGLLVATRESAVTVPVLRESVPPRTSRTPVPVALVTYKAPPDTIIWLVARKLLRPTYALLAMTEPPAPMLTRLTEPAFPTYRLDWICHTPPSLTCTVLLLLLANTPRKLLPLLYTAPLLVMVSLLTDPVEPTARSLNVLQTEPVPLTRTVMLLLKVVRATLPLLRLLTAPPSRTDDGPSTCTVELLTTNTPPLLTTQALTTCNWPALVTFTEMVLIAPPGPDTVRLLIVRVQLESGSETAIVLVAALVTRIA